MKTIFTKVNLQRCIIAGAITFLGLNYAEAAEWTKVNGLNPNVNTIYCPAADPGKVVVGSEVYPLDITMDVPEPEILGMGLKVSLDSGKTFSQLMLDSFPVYDIMRFKQDPKHWVAAVRRYYRGGIVHSTDDMASWKTNLTCDSPAQIYRIASSVVNGKEYFATAAIATTNSFMFSDDGLSSGNINNTLTIQSRDVAYSKAEPKLLFITGDHNSAGKVYRSRDNGANWSSDEKGLNGLRVFTVLPSSLNPAVVLCGADSISTNKSAVGKGIYMSLDTGKTWKLVGAPGAQVFDIAEHPTNPKFLVAACGDKGVFISGNGGYSWEEHSSGLPSKSVRNISIPEWEVKNNGFRVFAGVYGDGLYKSEFLVVGVEDKLTNSSELSFVNVYPQPSKNVTKVIWNNPISQSADISVYDQVGAKVFSIGKVNFPEGSNVFEWNCSEVNSGIYLVKISTDSQTISHRINVVK